MKTFYIKNYKGPSKNTFKEIARPQPKSDQMEIKVISTSLNARDWHFMLGTPVFMRLNMGLFVPKFKILGGDMAGVVTQVGKNVTEFKVGDEVFGDNVSGGLAEYAIVLPKNFAKKPSNLSLLESSTLGVAALTAFHCVEKMLNLTANQKVLINGGTTGVGSFAIQMCKGKRAWICAIASTKNIDTLKKLGAHEAIDYTQQKVQDIPHKFDIIIDTIGNMSIEDYHNMLTSNGHAIVVGFQSMKQILRAMKYKSKNTQKIEACNFKPEIGDLDKIRELVESGILKPEIEKIYDFDHTQDALEHVASGRVRGKIIVKINS